MSDAAAVAPPPTPPWRRLAFGSLAMISSQPLTWAATLIGTVFVPRFLDDRTVGELAAAATVAAFTGTIVALGVPTFVTRSVASDRARGDAQTAAAFALTTVLGAAAAALVFGAMTALGSPLASPAILALSLASTVATSGQTVLLSYFVGREQYVRFAWSNAIAAVIASSAGVLALFAGYGPLGYLVAFTTAAVLASAFFWRTSGLRFTRASFDPAAWWTLARGGLPFLGWNLTLRVYGEIDRLLLAVLVPASVLGWYVSAYKVISVPVFIPTMLVAPLLPTLTRATPDRAAFRDTLRRTVFAAVLLTVPISGLIIGVAPAIPSLFGWRPEFEHAIPLIVILALHQPIVAVDMVLATALTALHRESSWLRVGIIAAVFNPAVNLALIPLAQAWSGNGALAAAAVTVLTEILMLGGALILLRRESVSLGSGDVAVRIGVAGLAQTIASLSLISGGIILSAAVGGVVFVVAVFLLRAVRVGDLRALAQVVRRSPQRSAA